MSRIEKAYVFPFALFVALFALKPVAALFPADSWWLANADYWIFPLQTIACAAVAFLFWKFYAFNGIRKPLITIAIAAIVFLTWIAPQAWLGFEPRAHGFDPTVFAGNPTLYSSNLALRFIRLVIVVPIVEELFWRGFLLRYLIASPIEKVPFGAFTWTSFIVVAVGFMLEHQPADYPAALLAGALYNVIAIRTKSLGSCILAHAITNLLLGIYILKTGQFGFW